MLYIDKATILKFDLEMLKKHRRAIQFIAVLLFIVGLLCTERSPHNFPKA
ncbi:Acid resistance membrane protein HdeD [Escherichia coli]|nr:Acid resistance membrane protein HdeD [Escherichia coli]